MTWPAWFDALERDPDLWPAPLPPPRPLTDAPDYRDWKAKFVKPTETTPFWILERKVSGLHIVVTRHETWEEAFAMSTVKVFP